MNTENTLKSPHDFMLQMCIDQGYVPKGCKLPGNIVYMLTSSEGDACARCNTPRHECGGRPRKDGVPK